MGRLFGTDGIRARAGAGPLAHEALVPLGRAIGEALHARGAPGALHPHAVAIGRDPRPSGSAIALGLSEGLRAVGLAPLDLGIVPTPAVSHAVRGQGLGLGLVISASHNPPADNGVKVFAQDGTKADDAFEDDVERRFHASRDGAELEAAHASAPPSAPAPARAGLSLPDGARARAAYLDALVALGGGEGALRGLALVCDCAFGATCRTAREALERLGAEVRWIAAEPLGERINDGVGALHPEVCGAAVAAAKATCGFAFDGDGDRVIALDEAGLPRDGDAILWALARWLDRRGALTSRTIVATVMSSVGLEGALRRAGIRLARVDVGDRHVTRALVEGNFALGGEQSGHLVLPRAIGPTGDGLAAAIALCVALREEKGAPFSSLFTGFKASPQAQRKIVVGNKPALESIPDAGAAMERARKALGPAGRVLVRFSGTEPALRVLVEHEVDEAVCASVADELAADLRALPQLSCDPAPAR